MRTYRAEKQQTGMDPCQALANAIILQAVKDWRDAVRILKKHTWSIEARQVKEECERFFCSEWFEILTSLDGKVVLNKLKEDAGIDDK